MGMKKLLFLFAVILVISYQSCTKIEVSPTSNPSTSGIKFYGDHYGNFLTSFEATTDGNYMFGGYSFSSLTMAQQGFIQKCDPKGEIIWKHTYGGKYLDIFNAVHVTSDGGFIAAGETTSIGNGFNDGSAHEDAWLVKTDANGDTLWQKSFGGPYDDRFYDVTETSDHGFVAVGIYNNPGNNDTYVVKVDKDGQIVWLKQEYPNNYWNLGASVTEGPNGDIAIAGYISGYVNGGSYPSFILLSSKGVNLDYQNVNTPFPLYSMWGSLIYSNFYNYALMSNLEKIISRPDGYIMAINLEESGPNSVMVFKVDLKGNIIWNYPYFGLKGGYNYMNDMKNNSAGGLLISGSTMDATGKNYSWLLNLDANGNKIWENFVPIAGYTAWAAGAIPVGNNFSVGVNLISTDQNHSTFFGLLNTDQNGKIIEKSK
jgi:hypothetical protein